MRALFLSTIFITSFRSVSTKSLIALTLVKEESRTSLKINTICNFQTMKSAVELNRLYVKKFLTNQCKVQFSRDKLGEEKVLKSAFPDFLRA